MQHIRIIQLFIPHNQKVDSVTNILKGKQHRNKQLSFAMKQPETRVPILSDIRLQSRPFYPGSAVKADIFYLLQWKFQIYSIALMNISTSSPTTQCSHLDSYLDQSSVDTLPHFNPTMSDQDRTIQINVNQGSSLNRKDKIGSCECFWLVLSHIMTVQIRLGNDPALHPQPLPNVHREALPVRLERQRTTVC